MKRIISIALALVLAFSSVSALAATAEETPLAYSDEYKTSVYYQRLMQALEEHKDGTAMEKVLAVTLSQEGYKNYATEGVDLSLAKAEGKLWTGSELRMNDNLTGNTEYTRWAQRYIMELDEDSQYVDYDWCAIYVSWCLYQAGYYTKDQLKKYYYAYIVDPRVFYDADSWIESFNLNQKLVYYPPLARHKLDAMPWNTYYNVDIDPFEIPYKPGGLVFFSWAGNGDYFSHVGIVVDYDRDTHVLTYSNGNSDGMVITRQIDLDVRESFRGQAYCLNANRILAYADYDVITPPEPKEITCDTPVLTRDKNASQSLKIRTNSESVMASVYLDGSYHGSIIESNMIFHEGLLTIGSSELSELSVGVHRLRLVFDDGEIELPLKIIDRANAILGDADQDGEVDTPDVTLIQRYDIGLAELSGDALILSDVDRDDEVNVIDATWLQRYLNQLKAPDGIGGVIRIDI